MVCVMMALGEASRTAHLDAVKAIGSVITAWSAQLNAHVAVRIANGEVTEPDPSMHRGASVRLRPSVRPSVHPFASKPQPFQKLFSISQQIPARVCAMILTGMCLLHGRYIRHIQGC